MAGTEVMDSAAKVVLVRTMHQGETVLQEETTHRVRKTIRLVKTVHLTLHSNHETPRTAAATRINTATTIIEIAATETTTTEVSNNA